MATAADGGCSMRVFPQHARLLPRTRAGLRVICCCHYLSPWGTLDLETHTATRLQRWRTATRQTRDACICKVAVGS